MELLRFAPTLVFIAVVGVAGSIFVRNAPVSAHAAAPLVIALGDSITYGYGLSSPATQNYAALYAASIHGSFDDLAQPGYLCQDVRDRELPRMPSGAAVVIINCGTNDVGGFDFTPTRVTRALAATDAELTTYKKDFAHVLAHVRAKEPAATIILVNLRHWERMDGAEPPQVAKNVDAWNSMLIATGLPVIDLSNDPRMYDRRNFLADEIHPNAAGHRIIASKFRSSSLL